MLQKQTRYYTPAEYLALEDEADHKSEYFQGEIFAMAGGSINHNIIAGNVYALLNQAVADEPCIAFTSDVKILVKENGLYTYPDAMVVCGPLEYVEGRTDTVTNPILIVEVLSKSTRNYDRDKKFELYRALKSLQDYVLVDQERVYIEYYHKLEDGRWILTLFNRSDTDLTLTTIQARLPISQIYHKVDWSAV
ncbi:MAG: Uma2 family endonuclease [Anaerolineales bacterium]|nr:Uma2 family endonuclease [Anaerolineales bacterium]